MFAVTLDTVKKLNRDALAYLEVSRFVQQTCRRAVMDNARSPSQIPVERQISVEGDTSDGCNNIAAAQPPKPKFKLSDCRTTMQKH